MTNHPESGSSNHEGDHLYLYCNNTSVSCVDAEGTRITPGSLHHCTTLVWCYVKDTFIVELPGSADDCCLTGFYYIKCVYTCRVTYILNNDCKKGCPTQVGATYDVTKLTGPFCHDDDPRPSPCLTYWDSDLLFC